MKSTLTTMVCSLTVIAAVMGGVLAWVHDLTAKPIADAEARAKTEALAAVLPPFDDADDVNAVTVAGDTRPVTVYRATKDGKEVGKAVETWTMNGFSGEITLMVGFDNDGELVGYQVLSHAETPGLGAKAQEWFRDTVGTRSIIGTVSPLRVKQDGGEVDGITAATITSRAILDAVNRAREAAKQ